MSALDIRNIPKKEDINLIRFSDDAAGTALGKAFAIEKFVPKQFRVRTPGGEPCHINMEDVDNLILALQKAKELWSE